MIDLSQILLKNATANPTQEAFTDDSKTINWKQLEFLSGQVYHYLKKQGLSNEDLIMIDLPRGLDPIIAMMGIIKNGSAFVVCDENMPEERKNYIYKDSGSALMISRNNWDEVLKTDYLEGHETVNPHDAFFAVYTSGTTGNPKGVLHEYGNLDLITGDIALSTTRDHLAIVTPMSSVGSLLTILKCIRYNIWGFIISFTTIKNPLEFHNYVVTNRIDGSAMATPILRNMKSNLTGLKYCMIGAEDANRVYVEGLNIRTIYTMSEVGFVPAYFDIDRAYDFTPAGALSEVSFHPFIVDEEGNRVQNGIKGEICIEDPYVRGYINRKEETAEVFIDGIYHTRDLGYINEDGLLMICGRLSDMVKINGNRVEPAEIEAAAKKVLGVDWASVRVVKNEGHTFICVYYTDSNITIDEKYIREQMSQSLPEYMLPTHFIHIDEVPLLPNGKTDKNALPLPEKNSSYKSPQNEIEEKLCHGFASVFNGERISRNDDFFHLGGDSLSLVMLLYECELKDLTASDIINGRTPEKIAEIYLQRASDIQKEDIEDIEMQARAITLPLTPAQDYFYRYQMLYPDTSMLNIPILLKFNKDRYDLNRLSDAIYVVENKHSSLLSVFHKTEDEKLVQSVHPELVTKPEIYQLTESEMAHKKDQLVYPFTLLNSLLYRIELYETEDYGYLFLDFHHSLVDGASVAMVIRDILKVYNGETLKQDYYYSYLLEQTKLPDTSQYKEDLAYFERHYYNHDYSSFPLTDFDFKGAKKGELEPFVISDLKGLGTLKKKYGLNRNSFYAAVALLAVAAYNKKEDILITWTYHGHDTLYKQQSAGLFISDLPLAYSFKSDSLISVLYNDVITQIYEGIAHLSYPSEFVDAIPVKEDRLTFTNQENVFTTQEIKDSGMIPVEIKQQKPAANNLLDIEIFNDVTNHSDLPVFHISYSASHYKKESIQKFTQLFYKIAEVLLTQANNDTLTFSELVSQMQ